MAKKEIKKNKIKLIYNPNAGKKRSIFRSSGITLEYIEVLLKQYQLEVDYTPTSGPHHATRLAKEACAEGYQMVLAAGGDGTISEVANGLVGTDVILGVIPLGTYMNIPKMLSIPTNIEIAIAIIKIGRTRKIDVGSITKIAGEKLLDPYYFLETAGIGLDAELHLAFKEFEKGNIFSLLKFMKLYTTFLSRPIVAMIDDQEYKFKSTLLTLSNGPYTGAAFEIAPTAKLNDHKLTLSVYKMSKLELLTHFIKIRRHIRIKTRKIKVFQANVVKIISIGRHLHADASFFGSTPVTFKVVPNALNIICGFPIQEEISAFKKRTPLDP